MKQSKVYLAAGVFALVAGLAACQRPTDPTPTNVYIGTQTQTVIVGTPLPNTPVASPSPGSPSSINIDSLKVSAIGGEQLNPPKTWKVGARFSLTATPHAAGVDPCKFLEPCPYYNDSDIEWFAVAGVGQPGSADAVVIDRGPGSDTTFNRDFSANKPGSFTVKARFRGTVMSGDFVGTVTP